MVFVVPFDIKTRVQEEESIFKQHLWKKKKKKKEKRKRCLSSWSSEIAFNVAITQNDHNC